MQIGPMLKAIILLCIFKSTPGWAVQKALVIMDMQDVFSTARGYDQDINNAKKIKILLEKQKYMINVAKRNRYPIMIVEYEAPGLVKYSKRNDHADLKTNSELLRQVGNYDQVVTIKKKKANLFDENEASALAAIKKFRAWGVRDLIVMGANGGMCVEFTIRGALSSGFNVWAYQDGIADFNSKDFVYPYSYRSRVSDFDTLSAKGLQEFSTSNPTLAPNKPLDDFNQSRASARR